MSAFLSGMLVRKNVVAFDKMEAALQTQRERGGDLLDLLFANNLADESLVAKAFADEVEAPFMADLDVKFRRRSPFVSLSVLRKRIA